MKGISRHPPRRRTHGFALIELMLILVVLTLLASLWSPMHRRLREKTYIIIDQSNIRQILRGSALYNADNNDHMAHPTWGADLTGPDGWAYLTRNNGRVPGAANTPVSCAGLDVNSARFTNQLAFFKKGQITQYLDNVKTAWCPKDAATRHISPLRSRWLARPVKITSYSWNGAIGGYGGNVAQTIVNGQTYKVSQFMPADWQMWEQNDLDAFMFNDAASNPSGSAVDFSRRHTSLNAWWQSYTSTPRNLSGGLLVGMFGGSARRVNWTRAWDLANRRVPFPNELMCGPVFPAP